MHSMQNSANFLCSLLLRWSLQNLILVLAGPYLALVQGPGNHAWICFHLKKCFGIRKCWTEWEVGDMQLLPSAVHFKAMIHVWLWSLPVNPVYQYKIIKNHSFGGYGHTGKWIQENIIFMRFCCCFKLSKKTEKKNCQTSSRWTPSPNSHWLAPVQ